MSCLPKCSPAHHIEVRGACCDLLVPLKSFTPQLTSCTQTCSPAQHDEVRGVWHELPIQAFHLPLLQHADHVQVVCVVECLIFIVLQPLQSKTGLRSAHVAAAALLYSNAAPLCRGLWHECTKVLVLSTCRSMQLRE